MVPQQESQLFAPKKWRLFLLAASFPVLFFSGGGKHERETHQNQAVLKKKRLISSHVSAKKVHSNLFVSKRLFPIESMQIWYIYLHLYR